MTRVANGIDVEGPIQAEVFVVSLNGDHLELTGPLRRGARNHLTLQRP